MIFEKPLERPISNWNISDNILLFATSTAFYGLGIVGSCILMKNVFAAFSSAKNDKKTIFSIFKAWIEFLVSNNINL